MSVRGRRGGRFRKAVDDQRVMNGVPLCSSIPEGQAFLKPITSRPKLLNPCGFDIESKRDDTQEMGFTRPFRVGFYDGEVYRSFMNILAEPCDGQPYGSTLYGDWIPPQNECLPQTDHCRGAKWQGRCVGGNLAVCRREHDVRIGAVINEWQEIGAPLDKVLFAKWGNKVFTGISSERDAIDTVARWLIGSGYKPHWISSFPRCESNWREWHLMRGGCIDRFCRFIFGLDSRNKKDRVRYRSKVHTIFGHNAGRFDLLFILGWLLRNRDLFSFEITSAMSRIQRLEVWRNGEPRKKGSSYVFLDSVCILPMTLQKVGETFCRGLMVCDACNGTVYQVHEGGSKACPTCGDEGLVFGKRKMDLNLVENAREWSVYLRDDCLVLYHGLCAYQTMIFGLGGEVGVTAPATAMKLFRRRFQKQWITINAHFDGCDGRCKRDVLDDDGSPMGCSRETLCDGTCHGCLHEFVREGYYGGRTELFRSFGSNILYYDINSSYPASMREMMPVGPAVHYGETEWTWCVKKRKDNIGFVEAEVFIPHDCKMPPLPWRVPEGRRITIKQPDGTETVVPPGKLIFPTGHLRGVWDFDELCLVLHPAVGGRIEKVHRSVWFGQAHIFAEFVDVLYAFRNKDDPNNYSSGQIERDPNNPKKILNEHEFNGALAETCKLMLNSLYGKFGMREERTGLQLVLQPELGPKAWPTNGWPIDGKHESCIVWEVERVVRAPYIIPQISAHITALSRMRLFYGMIDVIAQGGQIYYCDTDSILCDRTMAESKALGGWKLETPSDILIAGSFVLPKLYQLEYHKASCRWMLDGTGEECHGCSFTEHRPDCPKVLSNGKKCPGCAATKQKMKGVGGKYQTPENWTHMVQKGGEVRGERLSQHRTMLRSATNIDKIMAPNLSVGNMLSPVMVEYGKSVRTKYDKRRLGRDGSTVPVFVEK